jgi:prolyl-tRNA synthetase
MRMSRLFGRTLREAPADSDTAGNTLLVRAGFIRRHGAGIYSYLPLAVRSLARIGRILREEMERIGGQELSTPVVHPAELWEQSGRLSHVGPELTRFLDRSGGELVLAMTAEEAVAALARTEVRSHRDLPRLVYQIQTKWRDDPRPRAGLIRVREFVMKDSYSLDVDEQGLDRQYQAHRAAYRRIFERCGLPAIEVAADVGMMGGLESAEFMYLSTIGEDTVVRCEKCGYAANRQIARLTKHADGREDPAPLQEVATPGATTIEELTRFLNIPPRRAAKAVFLVAEGSEELILAVIRGDMELAPSKLAAALARPPSAILETTEPGHSQPAGDVPAGATLRPATEEEIRRCGVIPGYGSPVGARGARVVVDDLITRSPNLVAGANKEGSHLVGCNYGRDYNADVVADIVMAREGDGCPECGNSMRADRAVEVGNIFKLGTRYSRALGCTFHDAGGEELPVVMGSYGIGVGRLLACIAEEYHDQAGLCWPVSVAPYDVHLVGLCRDPGPCESLYEALLAEGFEVLYDDRPERAGVKFNDADLIGVPLRLTLGDRSLERGEVELKIRTRGEKVGLALDGAAAMVRAELARLVKG